MPFKDKDQMSDDEIRLKCEQFTEENNSFIKLHCREADVYFHADDVRKTILRLVKTNPRFYYSVSFKSTSAMP